MNSLVWKIGPLRALLPGAAGRQCEGPDTSQVQARSVQVCACRSPSPQVKPSAITINAPLTEETSNGALSPRFNPLPLPSPRTTVPAPLKFLWFNRKNQRQAAETRDPDSGVPGPAQNGVETSAFLDDPSERTTRKREDTLDESIQEAHCSIASIDDGKVDLPIEVNAPLTAILSDSIMANHDPSKSLASKKSWISRITDLRALWPNPKSSKRQNVVTHPASSEVQSVSPSSSHSMREFSTVCQSPKVEGRCVGCDLNASQGCSLEVPYTRVLHSKESFSKFLQDTSLFEMKILAQMSFLCNTAYTIPDIQPGELLKHHHLKFVTSSLDKKAEAEAKGKEADLSKKSTGNDTKKLTLNGGKGGVCFSVGNPLEPSSPNSCLQSEPISVQPCNASECSTEESNTNAGAHVSDITEEPEASLSNQIDLQQVENSSQTPDYAEEDKCSHEESLMAVAPVTVVVLAEEETKLAVTKGLQSSGSCPCEWFVCDEPSTYTRIFVIQGSESLASWQTNLFFEPTKFEGLDVIVHRGIYEAANSLYEQVLPEVLAHFSAHGDLAQVRLTGHSLGGSLATLLALMFQIRGVLPSTSVLPVVTFGSPCIMCGGDYLLQKMKLPQNCIQSVIMHRDVVPRAFSCDYPDHVAQVLKRLNGRFRDHPCLNNQKLLYAPMGQILILQPDENVAPSHPLLPRGHGLYLLRHPINGEDKDNATELRAAQRAFLNMPHPLEILSDPGAYGFDGAVSRDHDPCSYMKAIHLVLRYEMKRLRRVQREQRRQLWWPLVIAESSLSVQKGLKPGSSADQTKTTGALTPAVCKTSLFFNQAVKYAPTNQIGFVVRSTSLWESQKDAFSRYARLIASRHVQMGMLLILSVRVVIFECLSTLFAWI